MSRRARLVCASLLVAYVLFLLWVLGKADPGTAASVVGRVYGLLDSWGAPAVISTRARVEMALNAAMFAPVALLGALTFPDHPWANWVVYGFVGSVAMEMVQGLWLPLRSAQYVDIVANTAGVLAGAVLSLLVAETHKLRPNSINSER